MKRVLALTAMALSMAVATPASAAVIVVAGGSQPINQSFVGFGGTPAVNIPQLTGTLGLLVTGTTNNGLTFNFAYSVDNTSSVMSMLTGFGSTSLPSTPGPMRTSPD